MFAVTAAVVKIGSSSVRFACGTNRSLRLFAGWAMAKRGKAAAATPAAPACSNDLRFRMRPLLFVAPEHVGFRNRPQLG